MFVIDIYKLCIFSNLYFFKQNESFLGYFLFIEWPLLWENKLQLSSLTHFVSRRLSSCAVHVSPPPRCCSLICPERRGSGDPGRLDRLPARKLTDRDIIMLMLGCQGSIVISRYSLWKQPWNDKTRETPASTSALFVLCL